MVRFYTCESGHIQIGGTVDSKEQLGETHLHENVASGVETHPTEVCLGSAGHHCHHPAAFRFRGERQRTGKLSRSGLEAEKQRWEPLWPDQKPLAHFGSEDCECSAVSARAALYCYDSKRNGKLCTPTHVLARREVSIELRASFRSRVQRCVARRLAVRPGR